MIVRNMCAAALGACLGASLAGTSAGQDAAARPAGPKPAATPSAPRGVASNQQIADAIASRIRQNPALKNFRIDVRYQDGIAELTGFVQGPRQAEEAVRLARAVPGVQQVRDRLQFGAASGVGRTQGTSPLAPNGAAAAPTFQPPVGAPPAGFQPPMGFQPPAGFQPPPGLQPFQGLQAPPTAFQPPAGAAPFQGFQQPPMGPMFGQQPPMNPMAQGFQPPPLPNPNGGPPEPAPIFQGPPGPNPALQPPPMPPYAWPTFAPYNNYSRVAYPNLYPYETFPYIGPFYPFPRVPLGWRSVSLTWQDGHWWYGKNATGHDWWRIRYH